MRRLLFTSLLFIGVGFFVSNFAELEAVATTFRQGDWRILAVALSFSLLWLLNLAATYRAIYRSLGVEERLSILFLLASASAFANVVTPSGVVGGAALFVDQADRRGYSKAKATLVSMMSLVFDLIAFSIVLVVGLIVLFRRGNLNRAEISASVVLVLVIGALLLLFFLGVQSGDALGRALGGIVRQLNRILWPFLHRDYWSEEGAMRVGRDSAAGLREIRRNRRNLFWALALALNNKAILIAIFGLMFVAFQTDLSAGTVISGFSIAYLFTIVSPTPSGIGVVEGVLPLTLHSMYVPLKSATVITLAFRGLTFWFPLLWGMVCLRLLNGPWRPNSGQLTRTTSKDGR